MDIDRAKAIADVGKVLVDSAKVEVAFIVATGADASSTGFIESERSLPSPGAR
ncbi:hypothetical protein D3C80_2176510 [compost metagenome]